MNTNTVQSAAQGAQSAGSHRIDITDRKKASLTGVKSVESSTPAELILTTALGKLEVRGSDLKITRFDETDGSLAFCGSIDSVKYQTAKPTLLKRIFK